MIRSMTAYTQYEFSEVWGKATWEIRSVNQRYLETYIRLPEQLRSLEPLIRERIRHALSRGKVECTLRFDAAASSASDPFTFNEPLARQLLHTARWILTQQAGGAINPFDLMRWPGVMEVKELDIDSTSATLLAALDHTLNAFVGTREKEGSALKALIEQRLDAINIEIANVRQHMPQVLQWQRERLLNKLAEADIILDSGRLEQELLLVAQRIDVEEELNRLAIHVVEIRTILASKGAVGRKLDFMMQECNREANTLASKSINNVITASAIEIKVLIEQMREQIQNIE